MDKTAEGLVNQALELHRSGNLHDASNLYNQVLNRYPDSHGVLYLLGDIAIRSGCNGLAINLLRTSTVIHPIIEAWTALGCAYRHENMNDEARGAWIEGLKIKQTSELLNNLSSLYSDHGEPEKALTYAEEALKLEPTNVNALWNQSLAFLTQGRWAEGWEHHDCRFDPAVQSVSTRRDFGCPLWDGQRVNRLAVHGEQGIGDEVMFLSMLGECIARANQVVLEVEPRLMNLAERSFPGVVVYGNEAAMKAHEAPFDASIALGSLGKLFRLDNADFPESPYLKADPERVQYWRDKYAEWGPRPFVGLAWQGGTKQTRIAQRTVGPKNFEFAKRGTAISLQYGEHAQVQALQNGILFFPESVGADLDELAAMIEACDVVITCAQTVVHFGGALGVRTEVMTPLHSSWRYGQHDGKGAMPWYGPHLTLHRQKKEGDWGHPLAEAKRVVDQLCREFKHADI